MVDKVLVQRMCSDIRANVQLLREATDITWEVYCRDPRSRRFVERTLHILVETCIDIAHHIISDDGFEEPTSYSEAFQILATHGVLPMEEVEIYERMARFRNLIVHYYEKIDDAVVFGVFRNHLHDFERFAGHILNYLQEHGT
ncbi:type VII toxin-antitoxin system HepT family RNase toxin [Desulfosoma caldarium]|uniref:Uncharacterized protein YutE (UPF0331/DUF86 family) n=1 Tax=Desulfosoma caldarium TaxID=610254 RepID=A0A3N1VMT6_9BACT|nr:DUF86 domain-containing protein [Desulfosoma caldarium]ROR01522.1 uncharacterized protein YutE (UPF0331/DUF86 family) [Desulfosoma caldarium]